MMRRCVLWIGLAVGFSVTAAADDGNVAALIAKLRQELQSQDTYRAIAAVEELQRMGSAGAAVLVDALEGPGHNMAVGFSIVRALESIGPPALPALVKSADHDAVQSSITHQMLRHWGPRAASATPLLLKTLVDPTADRDRRLTSASLLQAVGAGARDALPQLMALFEREQDQEVKAAVLNIVHQLGEVPAGRVDCLLHCLADESQDACLRCSAADILARQRPLAPSVLPTLLRLARSEDNDEVCIAAAEAIGRLGGQASAGISTLVRLVDHENSDVREAAARALASIGRDTQQVIATLLPRLESDNAEVRQHTLAALAAMGKTARAATPALVRTIQDPQEAAWHLPAMHALAAIRPDAKYVLRPLVSIVSSRRAEPELRVVAAHAVGELGTSATPAVPELAFVLRHPGEEIVVRSAVASALGRIGLGATAPLRAAMYTADAEVRVAAARALALCDPRSHDAVATLLRALADEDTEELAGVALADLGPPAVRPLADVLRNPNATSRHRAAAASALGRLGSPSVPYLINAVASNDELVVQAAEIALHEMGPRPTVGPLLEAIRRRTLSSPNGLDTLSRAAVRRMQQLVVDVSDGFGGGSPAEVDANRFAPRASPLHVAARPPRSAFPPAAKAPPVRAAPPVAMTSPPPTPTMTTDSPGRAEPVASAATPETTMPSARPPVPDGPVFNPATETDSPPSNPAAPATTASSAPAPSTVANSDAPSDLPPPVDRTIRPRVPVQARGADEGRGAGPSASDTHPDVGRETPVLPLAAVTPELKIVKVFYGTNRQVLETLSQRQRLERHGFLPMILMGIATVMFSAVSLVFSRSWWKAALACFGLIITIALGYPAAQSALHWEQAAQGRPGPVYGVQNSNEIERGVCEVSLPPEHRYAELESPSLLRLEVEQDPQKHIVVRSVRSAERDSFLAELQQDITRHGPSALVFVHGYNVSFDDAARRTAQMAEDLAFPGVPIFFSWPSQGNWYEYREDEKQVELAVTPLKRFLLEVARESGAKSIHLVAHSMGNRALVEALKEIEAAAEGRTYFNQVVLAAPDIDADVFRDRIAPAIIRKAQRVTLYASSNDLALVASRTFNSGDPRAGDSSGRLLVLPGIETIDVSNVDTSLLGHSYYGDSPTVLTDLKELLLHAAPADQRHGLEVKRLDDFRYWAFRPGGQRR